MGTRKTSPAEAPPTDAATGSTQQRILDAAEEVFARLGYHGATIRDITQAAGVQLSLARYHFGSKDDLFIRVLARRAADTCEQLEASLDAALRSAGPDGRLEAVVTAMVSVPVRQLAQGDAGWRNYLRLLSQLQQILDRPDLLQPFSDRYAVTYQRYRKALAAAVPQAPASVIHWALHFLQILVGHATLDISVTHHLRGQGDPAAGTMNWHDLRRHMVAHVVGGLQAQLALEKPKARPASA